MFTMSICIGCTGLFCWYFNINHVTQINDLFRSWAQPLRSKFGTDFKMTQYDEQIDKEVENMSMLEFFEHLMLNFAHYEELSQKSLDENKKRKQRETDHTETNNTD